MVKQTGVGDKSERWRGSYVQVRKDLWSDNQATNRRRLARLGVCTLPRDVRLLDVGAGDGNLFQTLREEGFMQVWGFEVQPELIALHPSPDRLAVASAVAIPYQTASMHAVIVMDVLHHLMPAELPACLAEIRRVLSPAGCLYLCEPSSTLLRKFLTVLLTSPIGTVWQFSRHKRAMVEQEKRTLEPWLAMEHSLVGRIEANGFKLDFFERCWLHHYGRFRAV